MKRLAFWLVLLNSVLVAAQTDLGMRVPPAMLPKKNTTECAATPSQLYPCIQNVEIASVRFMTVGYDARTYRIKYLFTADERFKTADGLHVGGLIDLAENEVIFLDGWHTFGPRTKDGWRPILGGILDGPIIQSADGEPVDLTKSVAGKMHRFKIIGFDKGGV